MITVRSYRWGRWGRHRPSIWKNPNGSRDLKPFEKGEQRLAQAAQRPFYQSLAAKAVNMERGLFRRKV